MKFWKWLAWSPLTAYARECIRDGVMDKEESWR